MDIAGGKLFAVRNDTHVLDDSNVFGHEKILQLIKSLADNCKLGLVVEGRKRDNFLFENTQVKRLRRAYAQLTMVDNRKKQTK